MSCHRRPEHLALLTTVACGLILAGAGPVTTRTASTQHVRSFIGGDRPARVETKAAENEIATPKAVPPNFYGMRDRSLFTKTRPRTDNPGDGDRNGRRGRDGPTVGRPETSLVFNGVVVVDEKPDALIQDLAGGKTSTVKVGDAVAGGRVSNITLDGLDYQVGGRTTHVTIGHNLEGHVSTITPATGPSSPGGATPSGLSPEDILIRLKQKRLQEQSGAK